MAWFGAAGCVPRPRIELDYTEMLKSLVAAGYGAAVLPLEHALESETLQGVQVIPLRPAFARPHRHRASSAGRARWRRA